MRPTLAFDLLETFSKIKVRLPPQLGEQFLQNKKLFEKLEPKTLFLIIDVFHTSGIPISSCHELLYSS
jgi:hypothetical protein